jgi:hypothetical protein
MLTPVLFHLMMKGVPAGMVVAAVKFRVSVPSAKFLVVMFSVMACTPSRLRAY